MKEDKENVSYKANVIEVVGTQRFVIDEVAETYKRVNDLKSGSTDNKEPVSFKFKVSLKRKHSVQKDVERTVKFKTLHSGIVSSQPRQLSHEEYRIHSQLDLKTHTRHIQPI